MAAAAFVTWFRWGRSVGGVTLHTCEPWGWGIVLGDDAAGCGGLLRSDYLPLLSPRRCGVACNGRVGGRRQRVNIEPESPSRGQEIRLDGMGVDWSGGCPINAPRGKKKRLEGISCK